MRLSRDQAIRASLYVAVISIVLVCAGWQQWGALNTATPIIVNGIPKGLDGNQRLTSSNCTIDASDNLACPGSITAGNPGIQSSYLTLFGLSGGVTQLTVQNLIVGGTQFAPDYSGTIPSVLLASANVNDSISCAASGTLDTPFGQTYAIPIGYFTNIPKPKGLSIKAYFQVVTGGTAPLMQIKMRVEKGGPVDVVLYSGNSATLDNNQSAQGYGAEWTVFATAPPGVAVNTITGAMVSPSAGPLFGRNSIAQPVAFDTNVTQTLQFTANCAAGGAGVNTLTLLGLVVTEIN